MPRNRCREKLEPSQAAEAEHATTRGERERVAVDLRRAAGSGRHWPMGWTDSSIPLRWL